MKIELADCELIIKEPTELGEVFGRATIGIKFKVGDDWYGDYRVYTRESTIEDVAKGIADLAKLKKDIVYTIESKKE